MSKIKLTSNLILHYVDENKVKDNKLITVSCFFSYHGEEGVAYLKMDKIDSDTPRFAMVETSDDLHDSFNNQIEENWGEIVKAVKVFQEEWKQEWAS